MGDFTLRKRHTHSLDLNQEISAGLKEFIHRCTSLETFITDLQGIIVSDEIACQAMMECHRQNSLLNFRYLETVDDHWNSPRFKEFEPRNAWSLYNAFSCTAKLLSPPRQYRLLKGLQEVLEGVLQVEFGVKYAGDLPDDDSYQEGDEELEFLEVTS